MYNKYNQNTECKAPESAGALEMQSVRIFIRFQDVVWVVCNNFKMESAVTACITIFQFCARDESIQPHTHFPPLRLSLKAVMHATVIPTYSHLDNRSSQGF